jgi:predicted TIM-barrel fold metal-dependent hydrolase
VTSDPALVIDCDSHVMEPLDLWENYIEPKYRDRAIRVVEIDGMESLMMDTDKLLMPPGILAGLGGVDTEPRARLFDRSMRYVDSCPKASYDPAARAAMLDDWGVDVGVLFPTIGILWTTEDVGWASASCRAYNNWQADFSSAIPGRTAPIAQLNFLDVDEAITELDRCLALGFRGVFAYPEPYGGRRPGHPDFDPIWARCTEADIPVCLHLVVRLGDANPAGRWYGSRVEDAIDAPEVNAGSLLFNFSLGGTLQLIPAVTSMVSDGVFDRHPELKVICVESGAGWAAYMMDRMDEKYDHFAWTRPLELRPSDYIRRNVYFVAEPEERTIASQLELVGHDRIMWGSDFPHVDSSMHAPEMIRRSIASLDPADQRRVLGTKAAEDFNLAPATVGSGRSAAR